MNVRIPICGWYMLVRLFFPLICYEPYVVALDDGWKLSLNAASWAISVYYAYQRTWKPFNPILGETYEMVNHEGITFIAEQVNFSSFSFFFSLIETRFTFSPFTCVFRYML